MTMPMRPTPFLSRRAYPSIAAAVRDLSDADFETMMRAEIDRRGLDAEALGARVARLGSEAGRMLEGLR